MGSIRAGWYADPAGSGERFWDGDSWTLDTRSSPDTFALDPGLARENLTMSEVPGALHRSAPDRPAPGRSAPSLSLILVGAALLAIGAVLPWVGDASGLDPDLTWLLSGGRWTGTGGDSRLEADGLVAHGFVFVAIAIVVGLGSVYGARRERSAAKWILPLAAGVLVLVVADVISMIQIIGAGHEVGLGPVLSVVGAVLQLAGSLWLSRSGLVSGTRMVQQTDLPPK